MKLSACIEPESPPSQHIRSCLSTLSSLLISCVNVRWKAVTSELSYPRCQQKAIFNCPGPYISELNLANLSQSIHNLTTDFVGDVKLDHAHVRRAKHGVLVVNHGEEDSQRVLLRRFNLSRDRCQALKHLLSPGRRNPQTSASSAANARACARKRASSRVTVTA